MYFFRSDLIDKKPVSVNVPHKKIMLCLNESSLNPFEILKKQIISKLENVPFNRYYNEITAELYQKLADYAGVSEENLAFGNGADEMLYYIFNSVRDNNESFAVSLAPSYFDYKSYSRAVGLGIKFYDLDKNYDFNVEEFSKFADDKNCKLVIICNPNNPTGNLFGDDKIIRTIENNYDRLVLLDETYFEFSKKTFSDYINRFPNLIIVRSFSKAFAAAGLRFGYVISSRENIRELKKVMTVFHLSLLIQAITVVMLDNKNIFLKQIEKTIMLREKLFKSLSLLPKIEIRNTATNFLPFSFGEKTIELFDFLSRHEIAIRRIDTHPLLKNFVRVSIGNEQENNIFLEKVSEFISVK
ncbi:MAG: histidinol-phosphate aminotransferase family protein [Candidatus Cloacimonadota bacterium]|nr:MAG: histidinol-phosphate aminotransferase family protein [Candidatus Cloacimonadota bacterium]